MFSLSDLSNIHHMQIYHSCNEAYRLSASGDLHVPQEYTDEYCTGPCLSETHYVLDCIGGIMSNFKFYNEATFSRLCTCKIL